MLPVAEPAVDLHIDLGKGLAILLVGNADMTVVLNDLHRQVVGIVGTRLANATGGDFHHHVAPLQFLREGNLVDGLALGQVHLLGEPGLDVGKVGAVLLDKGLAGEEQLNVHRVVIEGDGLEVLRMDGDLPALDLKLQGRLRCRKLALLLVTVLVIRNIHLATLDLIELVEGVYKELAPLVNRVLTIGLGQLAGPGGIRLGKPQANAQVGMLKLLLQGLRLGLGVMLSSLGNTILQEQVVGHCQLILRGGLGLVLEHLHETMILDVKTIVEDLSGLAQEMSPGIHQWFILKMLVGTALHGINVKKRTLQPEATALDHAGVGKVFPHSFLVLVIDGIRPEDRVEGEPPTEKFQGLVEECLTRPAFILVAKSKGNQSKVDTIEVMVTHVVENLLLGAILGNPGP